MQESAERNDSSGTPALLAAALVWGVTVGIALGLLAAGRERFFAYRLVHLALERLAASAWTYGGIAFLAALVVLTLRRAIRPLAGRLPAWSGEVGHLIAFLSATLPLWVWAWLDAPEYPPAYRMIAPIYPRSRALLVALFALVFALHLLAYFTIVRRARRAGWAAGHARALHAAAIVALVACGGLSAAHRLGRAPGDRPNVLILLLDTVRADRLSCNGYPLPTTPEIDAIAAQGIRFPNFHSTSSWTVPAHASLFTGLYPVRHQATQERMWLAEGFATLAEVLGNAGYQAWGASANPAASQYTNLAQGFRRFEQTWRRPKGHDRDHPNVKAFAGFLAATDRSRPYFAFLNFIDTHFPYAPPEPYLGRFLGPGPGLEERAKLGHAHWKKHYLGEPFPAETIATMSSLYDAELAALSHTIGELLQLLREDGRFEDTVIVVTSDHGESFGEHGLMEHVFGLYNTTVQVPLILRLPRGEQAGRVDEREGQLVDLFPTLLRLARVETAVSHQGSDLLAPPPTERRALLSELYFPAWTLSRFDRAELDEKGALLAPYLRRLRAVQKDGRRFIWSSNGRHELYDIDRDPGETASLLAGPDAARLLAEQQAALDELLARYSDGVEPPPPPDISSFLPAGPAGDAETRDALRSLGYVR